MDAPNVKDLLICRDCDTVYRSIVLHRREVAVCRRCDAVLARPLQVSAQSGLALVFTAAILFIIANINPILSIDVAGTQTQANAWYAVLSLGEGWIGFAALGLALTTFLIPAAQILLLLWVLLFVSAGVRPPLFTSLMIVLHMMRPWSMTEIFLLGALVAIVKLASWVPITAGVGIWALAGLTAVLAFLGRCDPESWWTLADRA